MDLWDNIVVWFAAGCAALGLSALIVAAVYGTKNIRARNERMSQCSTAVEAAQQFQKTRSRLCPEDSAECRKLEQELFAAVTTQCAKAVK